MTTGFYARLRESREDDEALAACIDRVVKQLEDGLRRGRAVATGEEDQAQHRRQTETYERSALTHAELLQVGM